MKADFIKFHMVWSKVAASRVNALSWCFEVGCFEVIGCDHQFLGINAPFSLAYAFRNVVLGALYDSPIM